MTTCDKLFQIYVAAMWKVRSLTSESQHGPRTYVIFLAGWFPDANNDSHRSQHVSNPSHMGDKSTAWLLKHNQQEVWPPGSADMVRPQLGSNDTGTALGQDGSDWPRDLATSTFDLGGHGACGWCGSSSSIHVPSCLKFVGLAI